MPRFRQFADAIGHWTGAIPATIDEPPPADEPYANPPKLDCYA
jgi:hypothetical protein